MNPRHTKKLAGRTPEEIEIQDLRLCAIHEAGHRQILELLGGAGHTYVWRNNSGKRDEHTWFGRCNTAVEPGTWPMPRKPSALLGCDVIPRNWRSLFGLAGFVGELMTEPRDLADIMVSCADALALDNFSDSDRQAIGEEITDADIKNVVLLLSAAWSEVILEAESLVIEAIGNCDESLFPNRPGCYPLRPF